MSRVTVPVPVSRALRGGSGKEEPLPKSTTLGAPPLPTRVLQAAPGNDGLPPTQPPLGTPRQPMSCVEIRCRPSFDRRNPRPSRCPHL